eukprot:7766678-Ditylum_brightwellii.AAC.1
MEWMSCSPDSNLAERIHRSNGVVAKGLDFYVHFNACDAGHCAIYSILNTHVLSLYHFGNVHWGDGAVLAKRDKKTIARLSPV